MRLPRWVKTTLKVAGLTILLGISGCLARSVTKDVADTLTDAASNIGLFGPIASTIMAPEFVTLSNLARLCFIGGVLCLIAAIGLGATLGIASATLRRFAGACFGAGLGCVLMKLIVVKFAWPAAIGVAAIGVIGMAAYTYGHRNWLERLLKIDLDRDGDIGVEGKPGIKATLKKPIKLPRLKKGVAEWAGGKKTP